MDYFRDRKSNIPFSLHDSRILKMEYSKTTLTLKLDRIFQYTDDEEKWYQRIIEFTKTDIEECDIMVFHSHLVMMARNRSLESHCLLMNFKIDILMQPLKS